MNHRDVQIVEGSGRCTHCKRVKPLDQFGTTRSRGGMVRPRYWCRLCDRLGAGLREETPERKAWRQAYLSRPEVHARNLEYDRRRRTAPERAVMTARCKARYANSPRGKLVQRRSSAVRRLEMVVEEAKRVRLMDMIETCDREIRRLKP